MLLDKEIVLSIRSINFESNLSKESILLKLEIPEYESILHHKLSPFRKTGSG